MRTKMSASSTRPTFSGQEVQFVDVSKKNVEENIRKVILDIHYKKDTQDYYITVNALCHFSLLFE